MHQTYGQRATSAPAVLGILLIAFGATALALRALEINLAAAIGTWGWPFFVIVPGLVLLAASLLPARPHGIGFATAGAIVTTVGALLLYQSRTGHWESWAYAWALIPLGAGIATVLYGLLARERGMVQTGTTMAGIAAALFLAGAWFFEGLFAGEPRPTDIGSWWPVGLIVLGVIIALRAFLLPTAPDRQGEAAAPQTAAAQTAAPQTAAAWPGPGPGVPMEATPPAVPATGGRPSEPRQGAASPS